MLYIILAICYGVTNVLSRSINYMLSEKIGMYQSTFFNYIFGLLGSIGLMFVMGESQRLVTASSYQVPWYAFTGGLVGVVVVTILSFLSPRVSSFYLTLLLFIGQLFMGILIDFVVNGYLSVFQVIGGLLVVAGLFYNLSIDSADAKKQR